MRKAAWDIKTQMGGTTEDCEPIKGSVTVRLGESVKLWTDVRRRGLCKLHVFLLLAEERRQD